MPRIIVQADADDGVTPAVLMAERVSASDFQSGHFSHQLVERIGWAVFDAGDADDDLPSANRQGESSDAPPVAPRSGRGPDARRLVSA